MKSRFTVAMLLVAALVGCEVSGMVATSPVVASEERLRQASGFPEEIVCELAELDRRIYANKQEEEDRRKQAADRVSRWLQQALVELPAEEVIELCRINLQLMPRGISSTWKSRLSYQAGNAEAPIVVDMLLWEEGERELAAFRVDYMSPTAREGGYLVSTPPRLMLKQDGMVVHTDLAEWKYAQLGSVTYTIHGLIGPDAGEVPDVVISAGPVGSGNYVYVAQLHFNRQEQKWREVWQAGFGHVTNVAYQGEDCQLTINYLSDKMSEEVEASQFHLR